MLYHSLFERLVPELTIKHRGDVQLYSLRVERAHLAQMRRDYVDAVFTVGAGIYAIPFIGVDLKGALSAIQAVKPQAGAVPLPEACVSFPKAAAACAHLLPQLAHSIFQWRAGKGEDPDSQIEIFQVEKALETAARAGCVLPGLSSYSALVLECDRYALAMGRAAGRRIIDLNPGIGFGTRQLARNARSLQAVNPDAAQRALAARFGLFPIDAEPASGEIDYCVALNVPPAKVAEMRDRAREIAPRALLFISSPGEAGKEALQAAGLRASKMSFPALGVCAHTEFVAWDNDAVSVPTLAVRAAYATVEVAARPLRVLFALRPSAEFIFGGDVVQVRRTAEELRKRGHDAVVSIEARPNPAGFDLVHLTNLTVPTETLEQAQACQGVPLALMPIFTDHADEAAWGMAAAGIGLGQNVFDEAELDRFLAQLADRTIVVSGRPGPPARAEMIDGYTDMQVRLVGMADYIIANALSEVHCIFRHLNCSKPFSIAPSCIDPDIYFPERAEEFVRKYGLRDFVLTTGRVEARKNQAMLACAMRSHPERQYVLIGGNYAYESWYGEVFRAHWPTNCVVLPHVTEIELAGAYAAARVTVLPSWDEVVSLSSLNAAACETTLVLTRNSYEHEYLGADAFYCDPGDVKSIAGAIDRAWDSHAERAGYRRALAQRVRRDYVWSKSAELTERAYYRMLADRSLSN